MKKVASKQAKKASRIVTSFQLPEKLIGEMIYIKELKTTKLITFDQGILDEHARYAESGVTYEPYSPHNPLLTANVIRFPSWSAEYADAETLKRAVSSFIKLYVDLPDVAHSIATYYVFLTWVYDAFNELPYLRVRGDFGSGKTRFLNVLSALCYKPIMASGASTVAPLFAILNQVGGTLILDEADFRFSSETADITKILNNGNARGYPVFRCQQVESREFKPRAYNVFGPKLIASRYRYQDDALESRCITFDMHFKRRNTAIPLTLPKSFEKEATALRNQLLTWRFHNLHKQRDLEKMHSSSLSPRMNQILSPLLSLVEDKGQVESVIEFAKDAQLQARRDRGLKIEADLLTVIKEFLEKKQPLFIGSLSTAFEKQYGAQLDRKVTASWIGGLVRTKLYLKTEKLGGRYKIADGQYHILQDLFGKYDLLEVHEVLSGQVKNKKGYPDRDAA